MRFNNLIIKSFSQLELINQSEVRKFFLQEEPGYVFLAPVKEGGILENINYPAEPTYINLQMQPNLIHFSWETKVKKLLFLGSSCIYPRKCPQPMKEKYLLTGKLEPTNESYALPKIAGLKLCEYYNREHNTNFISLMPSNVYGIGDNFDLKNSHVMVALIRRFYEAKVKKLPFVKVWGTGETKREFLYVDDLADACLYFMENYDAKELGEFVNIGTGKDQTIREIVNIIKDVVGFNGKIGWNTSKPDGTPRKLLDVSRLHKLGWKHKIELEEGIRQTYERFLHDVE